MASSSYSERRRARALAMQRAALEHVAAKAEAWRKGRPEPCFEVKKAEPRKKQWDGYLTDEQKHKRHNGRRILPDPPTEVFNSRSALLDAMLSERYR